MISASLAAVLEKLLKTIDEAAARRAWRIRAGIRRTKKMMASRFDVVEGDGSLVATHAFGDGSNVVIGRAQRCRRQRCGAVV